MMWVIMGPSGSGKSYFAGKLITQLSKEKTVIIIDDSEYYQNLDIPVQLIEVTKENYQRISFIKAIKKAYELHVALIFESVDLLQEEENEFLERLGNVLNKYIRNIVLMIDEAYHFFPRWHYPQSISRLMRSGRKRGIDLIMIYQQFSDIDLTGPRQANIAVAFKTLEPGEQEKLRKMFGINLMDKLGRHDFIIKNLRTGAISVGNANDFDWDGIFNKAKKEVEHRGEGQE